MKMSVISTIFYTEILTVLSKKNKIGQIWVSEYSIFLKLCTLEIVSTFSGQNHDSIIFHRFLGDFVPENGCFFWRKWPIYTDFQNLSPLWIFRVAQIARRGC